MVIPFWTKLNPLVKNNDPLGIKNNSTVSSIKRLGFFENNQQKLVRFTSSRFDDAFYNDFELEPCPFPNTFPFYVVNDDGNKTVIDYQDQTHYLYIFNLISDLDKEVLTYIAIFRDVQFNQIVNATGKHHKKVRKSLDRLHRYFLIEKKTFNRSIHEGDALREIDTYSIFSHGTMILLLNNVIYPEFAYKWKEFSRQEDRFSPIRHWKVLDAFLNFRLHQNFVEYIPFSYLEPFDYYEDAKLRVKSNLSKQAQAIAGHINSDQSRRIKRHVNRVRFNGQFVLSDSKSEQLTKFDLYPFITEEPTHSDLSKLLIIFKHYGNFENGLDIDGNKRYLLIIVDSQKQIELIDQTYNIKEGYKNLKNVLFLDLETTSSDDMLSSIKTIIPDVSGGRHLRTVQFKINQIYNKEGS